jgi:hypothetical protein
VKKPDVIQKNELYFCNQGSNVIQNQLSKSKHRLKSFVLQACVIDVGMQHYTHIARFTTVTLRTLTEIIEN